jgi:hypothetical protein
MQVTSNPIPDKQTGLERQVRSKEIPASNSPSIHSPKFDEQGSEKGAAKNETSDAAIEGFAGAVKKQIEAMTEADRQMLMKLPDLKMLELDDIDDIPEMIKNDIRNEDKNTVLLKFLRVPEFADLMRADNKPAPKTYTAQSTLQPSPAKHEGKILSESAPNLENQVQSPSAKTTQNISQKVNPPTTNRTV